MAFHNVNFQMVPITSGTYTTGDLGNNVTGATVHEIYCLTPGSISITAFGGGTVTVPMTAGQSIKVMVGACTVISGTYVGFKTQFATTGFGNIQWGSNP